MDPRTIRPESHVAQQSRRDKLRVQHGLNPIPQLGDYPTTLQQLSVPPGLHPDLVQVRNVRNGSILYEHPAFSSQMLNFAANSNTIHQELGVVHTSRSIPTEASSFTVTSDFNDSLKASTSDLNVNGNWKSLDSLQSYDRMVSYANGSVGCDSNQKPVYLEDVLSKNARISSVPQSCLKPSNNQYEGVYLEATMGNPSCDISVQDSERQIREMSFVSQSLCHNTLQDVVTSGSIIGNERVLRSSYGNQLTSSHFDNANNAWISRSSETFHQCSDELGLVGSRGNQELRNNIAKDASTRGLSLSLSSNPPSKLDLTQFGDRYESQCMQSKNCIVKESQDSKLAESNYLASMPKPSITSIDSGKSLHDTVGTSTQSLRNTGPLGPFTGYATILKSSRFLQPAQELLDEFCCVTSPKHTRECEVSVMTSGELNILSSANAADTRVRAHPESNSSGVSSPTFHSANEAGVDCRAGSSSYGSYFPEYRKKKARLLFLQEEVCRRYRQYQQQMQMVASSFETVAGLSAATPYVSLALKAVSRNFRSIRHAISDRLKHVMKALGEDLISSNINANSGRGDTNMSRLRYADHSFQKYRSEGANVGFLEPHQHIWRPQRGLPERSVAILRAWLFEHFLHPYPTDADKHMLATQTGLSRNQVSNWFINARVRIWKPMVEEIHMLETKCMVETNQSSVKNVANSTEACRQQNGGQSSIKLGANSMMNKHLECSGTVSLAGREELLGAEQWNQEKRSRVEFEVPTTIDGSLMNILPYQRRGIDNGGQGAVSLTLGLRHGIENAQQHPQQLQAQEDQLRRQFGGQMIHDFVG